MCRWFAYISKSEPCLLEDVLVSKYSLPLGRSPLIPAAPAHALSKQVHDHYLPKLLSLDPSDHTEPTTAAEITARNRLFNVDGFGMAWYTSALSCFSPTTSQPKLHPTLYKTIQPPNNDSNFRSICSNTASNVVFAHIRAATATAVTPVNNHPFTFSIHTIMHNGYISDFAKIKRKMCETMTQEAFEHIQGGTDTEHFAALLMSFLCPAAAAAASSGPSPENETYDSFVPSGWDHYHTPSQMLIALRKTISAIVSIQSLILGSKAQPNDLNIAITDGVSLVACRFRNHPTEQPPSLYYSSTAGVTLNRQFPDHPDGTKGPYGSGDGKSANGMQAAPGAKGHNPHAKRDADEHGKHFIVASEPTTYKDDEWALIRKNKALLVNGEGLIGIENLAEDSKDSIS